MYRRLQSLQGRFISYFYGEAIYGSVPTLVLSEIIGQTLDDLTMKHGDDKEFERKLEEVYKALTMYGVTHEDPKLDNTIDVGNCIMIFDLEQCTIEEMNWKGSTNKGSAGYLLRRLQSNRQCEDEERQREEKRRD
ncbi:9eae03ca-2cc7-4007-9300-16818a7a8f79-CDS [Sclerotinia trifoliorum]|uniref:9eae03ca-2cc7-4007-9300-16818a7a8f79-CDS n=1 Tax=Sclerotinia trifoliorum TaxID=28548 RepID=A0A8H2VP37_9HELO|nr:9eae03ca-2cc7-4007-9300-16818a7a8f79-CDS [Sclerotinia trifoliorum]